MTKSEVSRLMMMMADNLRKSQLNVSRLFFESKRNLPKISNIPILIHLANRKSLEPLILKYYPNIQISTKRYN